MNAQNSEVVMRGDRRRFRATWTSAVLLVLFSAPPLVADDSAYAMEYRINFLKEGFDNLSLEPSGRGATSLLRQTDEGVHITVPAGIEIKPVGFAPRFVIRGDFEITVAYQVKTWQRPQEGHSVGPTLYISSEDGGSAAAELGRLRRHGEEDIHSTFSRSIIDGAEVKGARRFPAQTQEGQLRLRREGTSLSFEVRDDLQEGEFEVLNTTEFSTGDITMVRVSAKRDDVKIPLEVLIREFRVRADELPHLPGTLAIDEALYRPMYHPPPRPTSWTSLATFGGAIALMLACGAGLVYWRKKSG